MELRPVAAEDMERMYLWRNDEEAATLAAGTSMAVYSNVSLDTLRALYEESVKTSRLDDKWNRFAFSIYTLEGVHIGNCDYRNVHPVTRTATIGIAILAKIRYDYDGNFTRRVRFEPLGEKELLAAVCSGNSSFCLENAAIRKALLRALIAREEKNFEIYY